MTADGFVVEQYLKHTLRVTMKLIQCNGYPNKQAMPTGEITYIRRCVALNQVRMQHGFGIKGQGQCQRSKGIKRVCSVCVAIRSM
jgi:hypothetical protein